MPRSTRTTPARPRPSRRDVDPCGVSSARRRRNPLLGAVLAFLVAVTAVVAGAGPAAAHDRLVSADPTDGATLVEAPASVTLTFSAEIIADGTFVRVAADGTDLGDVPVTVDGETVTATLPPDLPNGSYEVSWQVTSSDGHGIADVLAFTLAVPEPQPAASDAPAETAPSDQPAASPEATTSAVPVAEQLTDDDGAASGPGTVGLWILVAAAVVGGIAVLLARRGGGFDLRNGPPGQH